MKEDLFIKKLIESHSQPLIMFKSDDLSIIKTNKAAEKAFGYSSLKFKRLRLRDLFSSESARRLVKSSDSKKNKFKMRTAEGRLIAVSLSVFDIEFGKKTAKFLLFSDFPEYIAAGVPFQKSLTGTHQIYQESFVNMKTGFLMIDLSNRQIIYSNSVAEKIAGYKKNELLGKKIGYLFKTMVSYKKIEDAAVKSSNRKAFTKGRIRIIRKDNKEVPLNYSAKVLINKEKKAGSLIFIFREIPGRDKYVGELKESEFRYRELVELSSIIIGIHHNNKLVYMNSAGIKALGFSKKEAVIGKSILEFMHKDSRSVIIKRNALLKKGEIALPVELKFVKKDGSTMTVESSARQFIYKGKSAVQFIAFDITDRKSTEDQLRKFSEAVNQSPSSVIITDIKGRIEYVNKTFENMTGYPSERVMRKSLKILSPEQKSKNLYKNIWQTVRSGKTWQSEFLDKKKDGESYWVETTVKPVKDNQNNIVNYIAIQKDITGEKMAREELVNLLSVTNRYASELDSVFESIPSALYIGNKKEIFKANKRLLKLYGVNSLRELNELRHKNPKILKMTDVETGEPVSSDEYIVSQALLGETAEKEFTLTDRRTKNQRTVKEIGAPVRLKNKIVGAVVIITDITELKNIEKEIAESAERYKVLIEQSFDGIALLSSSGKLIVWNSKFAELLGYQRNELLEWNYLEGIIGDEKKWSVLLTSSSNVGETLHYESKISRRDGSFFTAEINIRVLNSELVMWVIRDISDRKAVEMLQEKLFNSLLNAQNISKTLSHRLIEIQEQERRSISRELHDVIGQALTAIKIDLLNIVHNTRSSSLKKQLNETIELIEKSLNEVRELSLNLRPSILDDLGLIPAIRWYADRSAKRTSINAKVIAEPLSIKIPPEIQVSCYRIIQEAITNIIKHAKAKNFVIELWVAAKNLHLTITDDGIGFNMQIAHQKAISGKSTGIMNIKERTELLGGWLDIFTAPNRGTKIHVNFPMKTS